MGVTLTELSSDVERKLSQPPPRLAVVPRPQFASEVIAAETTTVSELRSEQRQPAKFRIRVVGVDSFGSIFNQQAVTHNISLHGICFSISSPLPAGNRVSISLFEDEALSEMAVFEICWSKQRQGGYLHGAKLLNGDSHVIAAKLGLSSQEPESGVKVDYITLVRNPA